jgi:predicted DNA-binding protein
MKGITVKLPEATLRRLKREARVTGRSVAALVRERLEVPAEAEPPSVYSLTSDLSGSLGGSRRAATNDRRKFRR